MRFVFWYPYLMFHQAPYIRELAEIPGNEVIWCVQQEILSSYRERGYPLPKVGKVSVVVAPTFDQIAELSTLPDSIQVFFGIRGFSLQKKAFESSLGHAVRRYVVSENRSEPGIRFIPRFIFYMFDAMRYRDDIEAVLCIGYYGRHGGKKFFTRCGYSSKRIIPFLHVVEGVERNPHIHETSSEILYVGQLITRKRVDLLLQAFSRLGHRKSSLRIIGSGPLLEDLRVLANDLGVAESVTFKNSMSNSEVVAAMAKADVLVLPSRFDGWGAVVNEALMVGTPVVCSDRCGASDLIRDGGNGYVFRGGSVEDLVCGLKTVMPLVRPELKAEIFNESKKIGAKSIAEYFQSIVKIFEGGFPEREFSDEFNYMKLNERRINFSEL